MLIPVRFIAHPNKVPRMITNIYYRLAHLIRAFSQIFMPPLTTCLTVETLLRTESLAEDKYRGLSYHVLLPFGEGCSVTLPLSDFFLMLSCGGTFPYPKRLKRSIYGGSMYCFRSAVRLTSPGL